VVEALLISNLLLWVVVVVLAATVVALVRQVGVLHERVSPAGALLGSGGPRIGEPAPRFALTDWSGRAVEIGGPDAEGRSTLLVFASPSCPVCATMLGIVDSVLRAEAGRTRLVLASDGPRAEHEAFVRTNRLVERTYVLSAELGLAYQVSKLPYAALIDGEGVLRAKGLVNTREHVESLFEAMARGVASVQDFLRSADERPDRLPAAAKVGGTR
jgi:methylamine dehydrogenase accessory protein MauD